MSIGSPHVSAQIEKMKKKLKKYDTKFDMILQHITTPMYQLAPMAAACMICSVPTHDTLSCCHKDGYPNIVEEHFNMMNNFQRPRNEPYSNFYNLEWKEHTNFKWVGNQQFQECGKVKNRTTRA